MKLMKPCYIWGMRVCSILSLLAATLFSVPGYAFEINQRILANSGGANVRNDTLTDDPLFLQTAGVHGTLVSSKNGTAGGFSGLWWKIQWDSQPPSLNGQQGWTAESRISLAPSAGDVPQQTAATLSNHYYTTDNPFFSDYAPSSVGGDLEPLALGNCTWYANGRLRELGYNSTQLDALLHNAGDWDRDAADAHIEVNGNAIAGSIAQWDHGTLSALGHVAVVESVNDDGTITVTESSYLPNASSPWNFLWRHRTISHAEVWPSQFIHVSYNPSAEIVARYVREGGQTGAMDSPIGNVIFFGPYGGWNWWYQWFEKGFIWYAKGSSSTEETWSYAFSKLTDIYNPANDWVPLGWCHHADGGIDACYAP